MQPPIIIGPIYAINFANTHSIRCILPEYVPINRKHKLMDYNDIQAIADALTDDINANSGLALNTSAQIPGMNQKWPYKDSPPDPCVLIDSYDPNFYKPYKLPTHPRQEALRKLPKPKPITLAEHKTKPETLNSFGMPPRKLEI